MIISDLNHLELVSESTVVGGILPNACEYFSAVENLYINKFVVSQAYVIGNLATSESNANAYGSGTVSQTFNSANTTPWSSSSSGGAVAASNGYGYYYCC
jgi:hypothetical protein